MHGTKDSAPNPNRHYLLRITRQMIMLQTRMARNRFATTRHSSTSPASVMQSQSATILIANRVWSIPVHQGGWEANVGCCDCWERNQAKVTKDTRALFEGGRSRNEVTAEGGILFVAKEHCFQNCGSGGHTCKSWPDCWSSWQADIANKQNVLSPINQSM